jgi:hypothetical protein
MDKTRRGFNIAAVKAEIRAKMAFIKFEQEFGNNGNQNQPTVPPTGQNNNPQGNVLQQPQYGG